jgi:hypothetical protein
MSDVSGFGKMAGVTIIVEAPSDDLAAWIGVAGVAVGVLLTTGIEWARDRRTQRRDRRREIWAAYDELLNAAHAMQFLVISIRTPGYLPEGSRLDHLLALSANLGRVNSGCSAVIRLGPDQIVEAVDKVRQATMNVTDILATDQQASTAAYNRISEACDQLRLALTREGF